ncbi:MULTISPECIES: hypothetical protein [Olivibacter]|uniref:Uncharacterized protein n=1 Tax=Olivibacter jilunii TaxID=985016 RepID=A0ABW6AVS2_9SPHI
MANHLAYSGALKMFLKQNFLLGLAIITRSINEPLAELVGGYPLSSTVIAVQQDLDAVSNRGTFPVYFCEFTKNSVKEIPYGLASFKICCFR